MQYETIRYKTVHGIGRITLKRPEVLNALSTQMRAELTYAIREASREARVLVISGQGKAFCQGQDFGDRSNAANFDLERTSRDEYLPLINAITECPVPVVAAVNGAAVGAGANLALACDVVIASESAYFQEIYSKIGLIPEAGGTYALPRAVGMARAMGATLFGEKISARQAEDWGMIWEAVPDEDFRAHVDGRAVYLANGPTEAFKNIKTALKASIGNSLEEQLTLEARLQGKCGKTRDFKEGMLAFLDKRPAEFEGR